ncbi:fibrinogen-like protein 1 [Uranotaenia lowii]|uniref:fibrinogen-like protein 1 n=1 Tax=Uranotaenia lowii TaxID=190385 RepID=UPI00247A113F|nr:fibrinogen-like protein 1 [Uranotaenia lowii]
MLIKRLKIFFLVLVFCGSMSKPSCVFGCELSETPPLDTINFYLQNISETMAEHHQTYETEMKEIRRKVVTIEDIVDRKIQTLESFQNLSRSLAEHHQTYETEMKEIRLKVESSEDVVDGKIQTLEKAIKTMLHDMNKKREEASQTMNSYLKDVSQSLTEHRQTYQKDMEAIKAQGRDLKTVLQYIDEKREEAPQTCFDVRNLPTGLYQLKPRNSPESFKAFCDNNYSDGGWTVIQNRFNGSVNFYLGWKDYEEGFGDLEGEFWLGLEKIHQITSSRRHELVVLLKAFGENSFELAKFDDFRLADKAEQYALKSLGQYNGTAGNSLSAHLGQKFTTFDMDNDQRNGENCAVERKGAWWYDGKMFCGDSNLNGRYVVDDCNGMFWIGMRLMCPSLEISRMMIRVKV